MHAENNVAEAVGSGGLNRECLRRVRIQDNAIAVALVAKYPERTIPSGTACVFVASLCDDFISTMAVEIDKRDVCFSRNFSQLLVRPSLTVRVVLAHLQGDRGDKVGSLGRREPKSADRLFRPQFLRFSPFPVKSIGGIGLLGGQAKSEKTKTNN